MRRSKGPVLRFGFLPVIVLLVTGCAVSGERNIARSMRQIERDVYASSERNESADVSADSLRTLDDMLRYAGLHSPGLEAAFYAWKAAVERIPQARAFPDPRFEFRYMIEEVETRVGPQEAALALSQAFPWFGKLRLAGDAATENAWAAFQRYEDARLALFFEVKSAWYEYAFLARQIAITEENLMLLEQTAEVARTKYSVAKIGHADLIKAQVELGILEDRLASLRALESPLQARLNAALNRPVDEPLIPSAAAAEATDIDSIQTAVDDATLYQWAAASNPQSIALSHQAARAEVNVRLAGKQYFPDLMLGVTHTVTGEARMPGVLDSGKDPLMVGLSFNLPIHWGRYAAGQREARAKHRAALAQEESYRNGLDRRLAEALYEYHDSERKITLYQSTLVPKAEEALGALTTAYLAGDADFLSFLDAQEKLLDYRLTLERSLTDRAQRLAELEMLVGRSVQNSR